MIRYEKRLDKDGKEIQVAQLHGVKEGWTALWTLFKIPFYILVGIWLYGKFFAG